MRPETRGHASNQTRRAIIDAAIAEFVDQGLSGARVDETAHTAASPQPPPLSPEPPGG